jgi:2'-5' RNA ligase
MSAFIGILIPKRESQQLLDLSRELDLNWYETVRAPGFHLTLCPTFSWHDGDIATPRNSRQAISLKRGICQECAATEPFG